VARVYVGNVPRLGKAGRDGEDDVVAAILVMNRTLHTNDVIPRIKKEVERINNDGSLPPGVKIVPFYDRTTLVDVTTHTVLHNLIFGCLLGSSSATCAAPSSSASTSRSRCSSASSSWCFSGRTPTCCRSARSISASSSTRR
jgi:hypothetical protein